MSADHDLRRQHEDNRNELALRRRPGGGGGHPLEPIDEHDRDYFRMMAAVNSARVRFWALPAVVHTDDPRTALGRLAGAVMTARRELDLDAAVQMAALALSLVASQERAESMDPISGGEDTAA